MDLQAILKSECEKKYTSYLYDMYTIPIYLIFFTGTLKLLVGPCSLQMLLINQYVSIIVHVVCVCVCVCVYMCVNIIQMYMVNDFQKFNSLQ